MNSETIVAVYDTPANAEAAVHELSAANVPADAIHQHTSSSSTMTGGAAQKEGFWASLFGTSEQDAVAYDHRLAGGSTIVTVSTSSADFDRISEILERHHPIDLEEHSSEYSETSATHGHGTMGEAVGGTAFGAAASGSRHDATASTSERDTMRAGNEHQDALGSGASSGDKMQLAEEQLSVGKRKIAGGGTRLRRYTVEKPVEAQVDLHSEKVTLERHPVTDGRPVSDGNFTEKTIEMTESSEEAVVAKQVRVKEEVGLRKESTQRTETVKDTVRSDEVKIEQLPGGEIKKDRVGIDPALPGSRNKI